MWDRQSSRQKKQCVERQRVRNTEDMTEEQLIE